jgi:hypothetical protein
VFATVEPQQVSHPRSKFVVIERAQQMIGGARSQRPVDTTPLLVGTDDDDRDCGAGFFGMQSTDKTCRIELGHLARDNDEVGPLANACRERRRRIEDASRVSILRLVALLSTTTTRCNANARVPRRRV